MGLRGKKKKYFKVPCKTCGKDDNVTRVGRRKSQDGSGQIVTTRYKCHYCNITFGVKEGTFTPPEENTAPETMPPIEDPERHTFLLRIKSMENRIKQQNKELDSLTNQASSLQDFFDEMRVGLSVLPIVKQIPMAKISGDVKHEESANLLLSDHHINRVVNKNEMEGYAEFNFDIWANRYWYLIHRFLRVVKIERKGAVIKRLYIDFLGDMFNDIFRRENIASNEFPAGMAVLMGSHVIAQGIAILARHFDVIEINGIVGNESRMTVKKESRFRYDNQDFMMYQIISLYLAEYMKAGRVKFSIPLSPEVVVIKEGWKFLLTHGDTIKSWAGIPYYGINRQDATQQKLRRKFAGYDFWELAHFHTPTMLEWKLMVNGALVGADGYAKNTLHLFSEPSQLTFGLHPKYGITWIRKIDCQYGNENSFDYTLDTEFVLGDWKNKISEDFQTDIHSKIFSGKKVKAA